MWLRIRPTLFALSLLACSSCGGPKSVRPMQPASEPPAPPVVDCDAGLKVIPPELPEPTSSDPGALWMDDDFIIRTYGEARRQLIELVACVERWRRLTSPSK